MSISRQLEKQLEKLRSDKIVIIGIGNSLKGDDGAGPSVCKKLDGRICAKVIDAGTVPENYIQVIVREKPKSIIIIDSIDFGARAGEIRVFKSEQLNGVVISTHTLSPRVFADIINSYVDSDVYFFGIQPAQVNLGQLMSVEVVRAVEKLIYVFKKILPHE